ncbi:hypothetical protein VP01_10022g1 [Puccinia sorghi]|uniref:Uncharacterized protein n=1 Tax=Puccinia sorghi TaxID=27349 RepID=A0A0L6VVR1_9BASI|nr:hypothetical protein VP01_10022g1 [Puccinia sorghi]
MPWNVTASSIHTTLNPGFTMRNQLELNKAQVEWLKSPQLRIDHAAENKLEPDSKKTSPISDDYLIVLYERAFIFQSKLSADSYDLKLPSWAVTSVSAAWDAKCNQLGKGPTSFWQDSKDPKT